MRTIHLFQREAISLFSYPCMFASCRTHTLSQYLLFPLYIRLPSAFALDLFGFGVYTFPQGVAGAMSFHDPLEGTETSYTFFPVQMQRLTQVTTGRQVVEKSAHFFLAPRC